MSKKYTPYRGRRRGPKIFAAVVVVLVVAVAVVLVLAATRQIVFTDNGPQLASKSSSDPSPDPSSSPSLPASPSTEPSFIVENTPTPEPSPSPSLRSDRPDDMIAVRLDPRDEVALNGAKQLGRENYISAVMLDLSDEYGSLYWQSSTAADYGTADYGAVTEASTFDLGEIDALHEEGLYVIAQITSLRESYLWFVDPSVAVHWENGTRWLDRDRRGWLDPYNATAQSYITDLVLELIGAGVDEVCLRNFTFPDNGQTSVISYDAEVSGEAAEKWATNIRMSALTEFADSLIAAAEDQGGSVALMTTFGAISDEAAARLPRVADGTAAPRCDGLGYYIDTLTGAALVPTVVEITSPYTDPAAADEIRAAIEEYTHGVVLASSDGRYPSSW